MRALLLVVFCVSLLPLSCSDTTTQPTPVPRVYKIAFSLDAANTEQSEIYTIKPDGTGMTQLTFSPATSSNANPIWSPDGAYIYYKDFMDEANEIYRMQSDGNHKVNLTRHPGLDRLCDISPDGTRMAFVSDREGGEFKIFVMNLDSMTTVAVTDGEQFDSRSIEFTPDGQRLLYSMYTGAYYDLCLEGIDGTGRTVMSDFGRDDLWGVVSPDGKRIAYVSQLEGAAHNDLWVCSIDGDNRTRVTTSTNDKWIPAWSPDSRKVVFSEVLSMDKACIAVVNADGSNPVCLSDSTGLDHSPQFSPDGSRIAYISREPPTPPPTANATLALSASELFIMNHDGSGRRQLTDTDGNGSVQYLSWSPALRE